MECGVVFLMSIALVIVLTAKNIVAWQARMYRHSYADKGALEAAEGFWRLNPIATWVIGSLGHFIERGPEHPEEFPRAIWWVRGTGLAVLIAIPISLIVVALMRYFGAH